MSDQPDKSDDGNPASDKSAMPEPELVTVDDVHLADPDVSADAVEPTLNTSAEEVRLSDPFLGAAEISEDAAEAASLDEAAAEAESVAREAEEVGTLVGGPRPSEDPADAAAPSGTAPAGGTAGDIAGDSADAPHNAADENADEPIGAVDDAVDEPTDAADDHADPPIDAVDEEASAGLASFAVSGDEPAWTGTRQDQSRWDALFNAEQDRQAADAPDAATAEASDASDEHPPARSEANAAAAGSVTRDEAAPEAPWAQPFPATHPKPPGSPVPPVGGPYALPPASANAAPPTRIRARGARRSSPGSNRKKMIILGAIGVAVLALLMFAIASIISALGASDSDAGSSPESTPGADGIIAENVSPLELETGSCILGFDSSDVSADVTTVTCTTPHNAQLLATTSLAEDAEFPGEASLNASGEDLCNSVPINENAAAEYPGLTLTQVTPTSGTWADGDRRIDCFVVSDEGNIITDTLLAE